MTMKVTHIILIIIAVLCFLASIHQNKINQYNSIWIVPREHGTILFARMICLLWLYNLSVYSVVSIITFSQLNDILKFIQTLRKILKEYVKFSRENSSSFSHFIGLPYIISITRYIPSKGRQHTFSLENFQFQLLLCNRNMKWSKTCLKDFVPWCL